MMHIRTLIASGLCLTLATLIAACGATPSTSQPGATPETMAGMDHSNMPSTSAAPYDATFIDGMITHHQGAITMATQALESAEHPELRQLAEAIIRTQQEEIDQMQTWRSAWYPDLAPTSGMEMDMGPMEVAAGPAPFDQRFIEAMVPHHQGALAMARDALQNAERQELKDLAQAIIASQEGEIAQMRQWLKQWYDRDIAGDLPEYV